MNTAKLPVLIALASAVAAGAQEGPPPGTPARPTIRAPLGNDVRCYVQFSGRRGSQGGHFQFTYRGARKGAIRELTGSIALGALIDPTGVDVDIDESHSRSGYRLGPNVIAFRSLDFGQSSITLPFELDADRDVEAVVVLNGVRRAMWITRQGLVDAGATSKGRPVSRKRPVPNKGKE
jgi:hypothetical protein